MATKLSSQEALIENSTATRSTVRRILREEKLLEYRCGECDGDPFWNGQPLTLQLDHRNGVRNDHRLSNLRYLCPNCHSQQTTGNKKRPKIGNEEVIRAASECDNIRQIIRKLHLLDSGAMYARIREILIRHKKDFSTHNALKPDMAKRLDLQIKPHKAPKPSLRRVTWPNPKKLEALIWRMPATKVAAKYRVSSVAVKKWCKHYGISVPPRGYWKKKAAFSADHEKLKRELTYFTVAELAEKYRLSRWTLEKYCRRNRLGTVRRNGHWAKHRVRLGLVVPI